MVVVKVVMDVVMIDDGGDDDNYSVCGNTLAL